MGMWNVIQVLGGKVCEEEAQLVEGYKKGHIQGEKKVPVLFEEVDGVYVRLQGKDRKKSRQGGNLYLAKILAKKCSGKLNEVTERLKRPVFEEEKAEERWGEVLMSAKKPKKDGKGYGYPMIGHTVGLEGTIRGDRKKLLTKAGF